MNDQPQTLTPTHVAQVKTLIDAARTEWTSAFIDSIKAAKPEIVDSAKKEIDKAISQNQRVVLTTFSATTKGDRSSVGAKVWEGFKVLFPIFATAVLGYVIWIWQSHIQERIDRQTEVVKAELTLKGEFGKRKLDSYQEILTEMTDVGSKIQTAVRNPDKKDDLWPALLKFNETVSSKRLYMSDEAFNALKEFWQAGTDIFRGKASLDDLDKKTTAAVEKIGQDLDIKNLGKLSFQD